MINKIIYYILTVSILIISFSFEINGLILFFGAYSIFNYVGALISICKIYFGFIYKGNKYFIYIFTLITLTFASLDIYVHYKNSKGFNDRIDYENKIITKKIDNINLELNSLLDREKRLIREYGSANKREEAAKEISLRKDILNNQLDNLNSSKMNIISFTNFQTDQSLIKLLMIFGVELLLLLCIKIYPSIIKIKEDNNIEDIINMKPEVPVIIQKTIKKQPIKKIPKKTKLNIMNGI